MRKTLVALTFGAVMFAAGLALADRAITLVSAQGRVTTIIFKSEDNGATIVGRVCGNTRDSGGNVLPTSCYTEALPAGAFKTSVAGLFTGGALTYWKSKENL
jgi:hypothetical protein